MYGRSDDVSARKSEDSWDLGFRVVLSFPPELKTRIRRRDANPDRDSLVLG